MSTQRQIFPYILLILLGLWLFLPGLTHIPAFDRDEARFVQASKQMLETHNYEQINFQDKPRHLKPPGIYWLQSGATKVFAHGVVNQVWSYRIPSVLGGVLAIILLFGFFSKEIGGERAFLAAGVLGSSLLLVIESHMGTTDAMLLACMVLMQGGLWKAYHSFKKSSKASLIGVLLFWLGMAAGVFIKGTSPLIGLLTVVGLCISERSVKFLGQLKPIAGVALVVALSLIWIIPFSRAGHSNFLWDMIHKDALPKVLGNAQGHGAWPGYFIVLLPLIVAGLCIDKINMKGSLAKIDLIYRYVWMGLSIVLALAFPLISYLLLKRLAASSIALCLSVLLLAVMLFKLSSIRFYRSCILVSVLGAVFIYGFMCQFYLEALQPIWISQKLQQVIQNNAISLSAKQQLYVADFTEPSLVFYLGTHNVRMGSVSDIEGGMRDGKVIYALLSIQHFEELKQYAFHHHYRVRPIDFIQGFNYENGRRLQLVLIKRINT